MDVPRNLGCGEQKRVRKKRAKVPVHDAGALRQFVPHRAMAAGLSSDG